MADSDANQTHVSEPEKPDRWPNRIGVSSLGIVALVCVIALIFLSNLPEPPGTATDPAAQDDQPTSAGPVAAQVAGDTGSLGLLGQVVGVLGTIAAAAVGGISGMLTGRASTGQGTSADIAGSSSSGRRPGEGGGTTTGGGQT